MVKKLPLAPLALAGGVAWAAAVVFTFVYAAVSPWGSQWAALVEDVYPGVDMAAGLWQTVVVGGLYGFADGAIGALVFAWLFNLFAAKAASTLP